MYLAAGPRTEPEPRVRGRRREKEEEKEEEGEYHHGWQIIQELPTIL